MLGSIAARHIAMYNFTTGQWSAMGAGRFGRPQRLPRMELYLCGDLQSS